MFNLNTSRVLFITIVATQLIIIFGICKLYFLKNRDEFSKHISIDAIKKDFTLFGTSSRFKNFYESTPNTVEKTTLPYINTNGPAVPVYKINADTLNQLSNYSPKKPHDIYRIVFLGDSFTFGENVDTQQNYPSQLERELNDSLRCKNISTFQEINLGMKGYDIQYSVERYRLRGVKYKPDLVIWLLINDDFRRIDEIQDPILKSLYGKYNPKRDNYFDYFRQAWSKAEEETNQKMGGEKNILTYQSNAMIGLNKYYQGQTLIVTIPTIESQYMSIIKSYIASRKGVSLFQLPDDTLSDKHDLLPDGHPSPEGYSDISKDIFTYLKKNHTVPCEE